jgi:hypothetical protein
VPVGKVHDVYDNWMRDRRKRPLLSRNEFGQRLNPPLWLGKIVVKRVRNVLTGDDEKQCCGELRSRDEIREALWREMGQRQDEEPIALWVLERGADGQLHPYERETTIANDPNAGEI